MPNDAQLVLLDSGDVRELLEPAKVFEAMKQAFTLHSQREGRVFPVVREQLHTNGVFGIKSGDVPNRDLLGFKAAGFWPSNRRAGKEPHQATILLIDPHTGRPRCLIDGNAITTVRTGAAGALGLTLLARPESTSLCIFGTGTQARIQLSFALRYMPNIRRVRYLTVLGQPDNGFEEEFGHLCVLAHARDADAAVSESDIVVTATPGGGPLFSRGAVRAGTHLNCVGADTKGKRELPEGLLRQSRLFADDREQSRSIGEGQWDTRLPLDRDRRCVDWQGAADTQCRRYHHLRHDRIGPSGSRGCRNAIAHSRGQGAGKEAVLALVTLSEAISLEGPARFVDTCRGISCWN